MRTEQVKAHRNELEKARRAGPNREQILAQGRARYAKNREKILEKIRGKARWYHIKHKYGLTQEDWEALFASQGNVCGVCGAGEHGSRNWHTDHTEVDGVKLIRGILCHRCNLAIQKRTSSALYRAFADYIDRHQPTKEK